MTQPTPALVTQRAAQRLPRIPLLLLCAAYVLPGVFGRDPWRDADLTAFGTMLNLARGRTSWLTPTLGGLPPETALLPHWLGAAFIRGLSPMIEPALAARLAFAMLLALTLALVWYTTYHLARSEAAQPVAFAFGGEARPVDYARALADGAVLAQVATLGMLQLGHETTPELMQLSEVALFMWALAASPARGRWARLMACVALVAMALSGAPTMAMILGLLATLRCWHAGAKAPQGLMVSLIFGLVLAAASASLVSAWHWRIAPPRSLNDLLSLARELVWFCWPAWPLVLWTLWRWRRHGVNRHISVPLWVMLVGLLATLSMGGSDRALMLATPGMAVLAAFALPTLQRSTGAAMDWFSVFFFTGCAVTGWVIYLSMQTGVPAQPLANIQRLAPGFQPRFSGLALMLALAGTVAWLALVRWRTARHRDALWKSLVLPASGVSLAWLLAMTLWLPALDYARSPRPLVALVGTQVPFGSCVLAPSLDRSSVAALEVFGHYQVLAQATGEAASRCPVMLMPLHPRDPAAPLAGWRLVTAVAHPADRADRIGIYRRQPG